MRRLDQLLSSLGYGSRRDVASYIREGRVAIAGTPATRPDQKADPLLVTFDQQPLEAPFGLLVMLHKPTGYSCTHSEAEGSNIYELLPDQWRDRHPVVTSIGRLRFVYLVCLYLRRHFRRHRRRHPDGADGERPPSSSSPRSSSAASPPADSAPPTSATKKPSAASPASFTAASGATTATPPTGSTRPARSTSPQTPRQHRTETPCGPSSPTRHGDLRRHAARVAGQGHRRERRAARSEKA
jgi:hypothetical protein